MDELAPEVHEVKYVNWPAPLLRDVCCFRILRNNGYQYYMWLRDLPLAHFNQRGSIGREEERWKKKFKKAMWPEEHLTKLIHQSDQVLLNRHRHAQDLPARDVATTEHASELPNVLFMLHQTRSKNDLRQDDELLCASVQLWQNLLCSWEGQEIPWRLCSGDVVSLLILGDGLVDASSLCHKSLCKIWNAIGNASKIDLAALISLVQSSATKETFSLFQGLGQVAAQSLTEQWDNFSDDVLKANVPCFRFTPGPNDINIFLVALSFFQHPSFMPDR